MPAAAPELPVSLFYSYAHEDEKLRNDLERHLKILEVNALIEPWHDREIVPGQDWDAEIDGHLRGAELILLLVSSYFVGSEYIRSKELVVAMERQQQGLATVVPILLRPVDLQPEDAARVPFVGLFAQQGLPRDLKPVTNWRNRENAWVDVAKGLRATVKSIQAKRAQRPPPPPEVNLVLDDESWTDEEFRAMLEKPFGGSPKSPAPDLLLQRVVGDFAHEIGQAQAARGGPQADPQWLAAQAMTLIRAPRQHRVLWVDDHPDNNRYEADALAKLQIEVVAVEHTDEALALLAADTEGFDLVISDRSRDGEAPEAGLRLLQQMRAGGRPQPFVIYHGSFGAAERHAFAQRAVAAGALGEAVLPDQLLRLVLAALDR